MWSETFRDTRPETLELAFRNYLKTGKYFPKPGDIWECIEQIRGAMSTENLLKHDDAKLRLEQESKEWAASSMQARQLLAKIADGVFEPKRNTREHLKLQAAELMKKRGTAPTGQPPNVNTVVTKELTPEKP